MTRSAPTRFIPASCRQCAHPVAPPILPCGPNACASFRCAGREKLTRWRTPFCSWLPMSRPTSRVRKSTWTAELSPYRPAPRHGVVARDESAAATPAVAEKDGYASTRTELPLGCTPARSRSATHPRRFVADSSLEESGFEPLVPLARLSLDFS